MVNANVKNQKSMTFPCHLCLVLTLLFLFCPNFARLSAVLATASPLKFPDAIKASEVPVPNSERMHQLVVSPARHIDLEKGQDWTAIIRAKVEEISQQKPSQTTVDP